jgi:hypothetical protein
MTIRNMAASEYVRYFKSARMIQADHAILDVQTSSFPHYSKDDQTKTMRLLKDRSTQFLHKKVKDFAEVAANFAKRLTDGGH